MDDLPGLTKQILEGEHALRREVVVHAGGLRAISPEGAHALLDTFSKGSKGASQKSAVVLSSKNELDAWVGFGRELLDASSASADLCREYFHASPAFLKPDTFRHLQSWVGLGHKILEDSHGAAIEFFRATPAFLESRQITHIRQWAGEALQVLATGDGREAAAIAYLRSSPDMHRFLAILGFSEWRQAGLLMARHSDELGSTYFDLWPDGLSSLYESDVRDLLNLVTLIARASPEQAMAFYERAPRVVVALNPLVRSAVCAAARRLASQHSENAADAFDQIAAALLPLANPAQESVMDLEARIRDHSVEAASAFLGNAGAVISEISEDLLPHWVEDGLAATDGNASRAVEYFSLGTEEAREALSKWREAVLLEDCKQVLTIFAHALTGQEMCLKSAEENGVEAEPVARQYSVADGQTIFLPPCIAEAESRDANFRLYKVATAHHAGYVEFGTFAAGLSAIASFLRSFPQRELAADIFFVLEDSRIDRQLKQEYAGLSPEIDEAVSGAMRRRPFPEGDPLHEALEVLLRLSVGCFEERSLSPEVSGQLDFLRASLRKFRETAQHVWDTSVMTVELYQVLSALPAKGGYVRLAPPPFWERPEIDLDAGSGFPGDAGDDVEEGEHGRSLVSVPLSKEELEKLLEKLKDLLVQDDLGDGLDSQGLYVTGNDLEGSEAAADGAGPNAENRDRPLSIDVARPPHQEGPFYYDEWDYLQGNYRRRWCCLREERVSPVDSGLFDAIHDHYSDLIQKVKRQFRQIRPEYLETVSRVDAGDELYLPAVIQNVVDRKAGSEPSDRIFSRKERKIRKISTLLLIDMSASTDERVPVPVDADGASPQANGHKRIIDIEIESLVVMTEALEALDDEYALYGFSGQGRQNVDFYAIKEFGDPYSEHLKQRISGIRPKQGTRMGPAIRHATQKLRAVESDHRLLIILSDGFPQDTDYGEDRSSKEYGLNDTMMALIEAKKEGIRPFCLTVDQTGNDYLRKMCDPSNYLIIKDIHTLPQVLPKVVESLLV